MYGSINCVMNAKMTKKYFMVGFIRQKQSVCVCVRTKLKIILKSCKL